MKEWHDQKVEVDLCVIGNKGASFFRSFGGNVVATRRSQPIDRKSVV